MKIWKLVSLIPFFLLCSTNLYSQRYWIASTSSNWNNTANWSATSGGVGGASVPGSSDAVIFNGAGGHQGNCVLDTAPTVASITVNGYTGIIDLNGFSLTNSGTAAVTFTTGTITNGGLPATVAINTTGVATFNGTRFGISTALAPNVTCTASQLYLNGSVFYGTTYLEKTGSTNNLGAGGNTFHGITTIANSGSAYLATGFSSPDVFNEDLTVTNTGSSFIGLADNTLNNMFNGNITLNSTGSGSGFFSGILFSNGPGASGTKSSYLATGKTIRVGTGYTSGTLSLAGIHQADAATAQSLTLTGSSILYIGPSASWAGNVMFKAPQVYLQGCTYSGTAYLEKSGGTNNLGNGGNTFQATTTIVNSGSAFLATGYTSPDTFNGDLIVTNTGTGWIAMADNASGNAFNGNITVNSTNAGVNAGITFGNGPGTHVTATLASGKTIAVGTGFSAGRLLLRRFLQAGGTAQNLAFTGTAALYLGPYSTFNGDITFTAPQIPARRHLQ